MSREWMTAKVVVRVDDRLYESLCRLAYRAKKPVTAYVREHLQEFVDEYKEGPQ